MKFLLLALALCTALPSFAQAPVRRAQVYRCGADGRDLRDSPCPSGMAASSTDTDQPATDGRNRMAEAKLAAARRASEAEARRQHSQAYGLQALPVAASVPEPVRPTKPLRPVPPASSAGR